MINSYKSMRTMNNLLYSIFLWDSTTYITFFTCFLLSLWLLRLRSIKHMPPGPFQWPILGCVPQLALHARDPIRYIHHLGDKYKGLFTMQLGDFNAVFITDFRILKEAFVQQSDCFSDRPLNVHAFNEFVTYKGARAFQQNGIKWMMIRRFVLSGMRDIGMGRKSVEDRIKEEARAMRDEISCHIGKPYDPSSVIEMMTTNIMFSVVIGDRYEYNDPIFVETVEKIGVFLKSANPLSITSLFLALQRLPCTKVDRINIQYKEDISQMILEEITKHKENYDGSYEHDLIDKCLQKQQDPESKDIFTNETFCEIVFELFFVGTDTSSTTLRWAILYLIENPKVQDKCYKEIIENCGQNLVSMSDRPKLPYVEATLCEVARKATIVPLGTLHETAYDTELCGYKIPKGTWVFPILYSIHNDDKLWVDPNVFNPERFLDENGTCQKAEYLIPFSLGRRMCPGEPLARMELFIFFTTLVQNFQFSLVPGTKIDFTPILGSTSSPKKQEIVVSLR